MYRYSRGYYKGGKRYTASKKFYNFGSRGSSTRKAIGSARASKNGSKLEYYNCSVNGFVTFYQPKNTYYASTVIFSPLIGGVSPSTGQLDENLGVHGAIVNDRGFRMRTCQYDEMRIVSMKIKLTTQGGGAPSTTIAPNQILSICDRRADDNELKPSEASMTDIGSDTPSPREIEESAGVIITQWNANRIGPITRTVYARDLIEKSYTDCTLSYDEEAGAAPTSHLSIEALPNFCPAVYFTIKTTTSATQQRMLSFTYSVEYNIIFRNPKSDLQTFIIKENPEYNNPAGRNSRFTIVKSANPLIPDQVLNSDGTETRTSKWKRYLAQLKLKKAETRAIMPDASTLLATVADDDDDDVEEGTKEKPMEIEDDFGTA